ncbi:MAG: hypothetical protein KGQ59_05490, partial [Bdellovibrionales bacterium]|nr:hypothetical protein [Bdellovibrionales bacterium]
SAYQFKSLNQTVQGKSLTSLGLAGIDKTGRASSGELKGATRNLDQDLPAIQELAKFIADKSAGLRPTMPSVAALDKIHSEYSDDSPEARQRALLKGIKGLFGGER